MYKNTYYNNQTSEMFLCDEDGLTIEKWSPYVFIPSNDETKIHSIYGENVVKQKFQSFKEYSQYQRSNDEVFENLVPPQIQYLTEKYHHLVDPELPDLHICYLDIETPHDNGFPTVSLVPAPIVLIAVVDEKENRTVFGIGDYNGANKGKVKYIQCDSEMELLNVFFNWMHSQQFDIITGWNITPDSKMNRFGGFDIPYIIRRSIKVFGETGSQHKKLSPINKVKCWEAKEGNDVYNVEIAGVSIIDYLGLYKWFTFNNLESFKLDYVAQVELKQTKLDYSEFDTMYDFYRGNWDKFVDYCIQDSDIVLNLETKCGYIALAQMLTTYCCCPLKNFNASVPLIEGLMLRYFRDNDLCAPRLKGGSQVWFPAAYVKEPQVGLHRDIVDVDIASSYPTHIIILNMSLETYFGRIIGFDEFGADDDYLERIGAIIKKSDVISDYRMDVGIHEPLHEGRPIYDLNVEYTRNKVFPPFTLRNADGDFTPFTGEKLAKFNVALKKKLLCVAPNGAVFRNNKKGVIAKVEQDTYNERVKQKGLKSKYKKLIKEDPDNAQKWKEMSENRHVLQWAIKILINSMFGVMGVPYSRYNNVHMAEAITSCGRHSIKESQRFTNELLNNPSDELLNIIKEIKGE